VAISTRVSDPLTEYIGCDPTLRSTLDQLGSGRRRRESQCGSCGRALQAESGALTGRDTEPGEPLTKQLKMWFNGEKPQP
jgi:hypothetical protein